MRVISEKKFREFWSIHPEAEAPLRAFARVARQADWRNFAEIRSLYAHADQVGRFTVFNVGGNKFRLITVVAYDRGILYIREVLTHKAYDAGRWKDA